MSARQSLSAQRWIAECKSATQGQILGNVAAHEIGHLLLGTLEHSPNGIMKADWRGRTLGHIARRDLHFDSRQAELMRKHVQERKRRSDESRIAARG